MPSLPSSSELDSLPQAPRAGVSPSTFTTCDEGGSVRVGGDASDHGLGGAGRSDRVPVAVGSPSLNHRPDCGRTVPGLGPRERVRPDQNPDPPSAVSVAIGVFAVMVVLITWSGPIATSLDGGIYLQDSLWYHLTLAAGFLQDGQIGGLHITDPLKLAAWFFP